MSKLKHATEKFVLDNRPCYESKVMIIKEIDND